MNDIKETIRQLESLKDHCIAMQQIDDCKNYGEYISAVDMAIGVLKKEAKND